MKLEVNVKKKSKLNLSKGQLQMAQRYEKAWHKVFYDSKRWVQETVVAEPDGRHAKTLAHEAALLAESNQEL